MPVAAVLAAVVEETFFRGVLLRVITDRLLLSPWVAMVRTGDLFIFQQLLQVRTGFQALVIGCGCAAISLVGGSLVVLTGSVVPAIIAHGSFVLFFLSGDSRKAARSYSAKAATVTR
jgi:membrane protease YdiL (CAAX protease family)